MPIPDSKELQTYIDTLIGNTRDGVFQWGSVNPTTYVWQRTSANNVDARLSLQRVDQTSPMFKEGQIVMNRTSHYLLQAFEVVPNGKAIEKLKIDGDDDEGINKKLELLFNLIASGISKKGLDFLKNLLQNP